MKTDKYDVKTFWESGIEDYQNIDKDLLKFYFEQAEKSLKSTLELADKISTRAYALLAVVIPILTLSLANISNRYYSNDFFACEQNISNWVFISALLVSLYFLIKVVFPKDYSQLGREPQFIVKKDYYDNEEYKGELSYKLMLSFEIEDYQQRINHTPLYIFEIKLK